MRGLGAFSQMPPGRGLARGRPPFMVGRRPQRGPPPGCSAAPLLKAGCPGQNMGPAARDSADPVPQCGSAEVCSSGSTAVGTSLLAAACDLEPFPLLLTFSLHLNRNVSSVSQVVDRPGGAPGLCHALGCEAGYVPLSLDSEDTARGRWACSPRSQMALLAGSVSRGRLGSSNPSSWGYPCA